MLRNNSVIWGVVCLSILLIVPITAFAGNVVYDPVTGKFNVVVSVRWNATQAELDDICAEFQSASEILLDATDGDHQFGIVYIANNSTASNAADFWIVNAGGRSGAPTCRYGVNGQHIDMRRGVGPVPAARYDEVIVHEFAHYAYCVRDEYEGPPTGGCGEAACNGVGATCIGGANACLMEGPDDGNSEFCWSGNHDPDQDTEQHCDHCQSCWATMAGRAFDLVDPTSAPTAAAPAADNIACIFVDDVPRIVLVLDRSGSMVNDSRLIEAQKAARLIVDLVEDGTFLGVASFSTGAGPNPDYDLQTITTAGDRTDAKNAIDGLSPGGDTNYSAGLDLALQEFTRVGLAAANKSIVFLSDGENNTPGGTAAADVALWDKIDDLIDGDIVVNTLGVGPLLNIADEDRLRRMADDTGGEYARTPVPTTSQVQAIAARSWSVDDYKPSLARYWASAEERAEVMNSSGPLPPGATKCDMALVDASMAQATFVTTWNGSEVCSYPSNPGNGLTFWLVAPDNSTIDPSMSGQPGIKFVQDCGAGYAFFKISAPALMEGEWQFCASNETGAPPANQSAGLINGLEVFSQVFAKSALVWQTCNALPDRLIGMDEDVFVEASAFFGGSLSEVEENSGDAPQGPANTGEFIMTGHLLNTNGDELYLFPLHDLGDGASGDKERADGIFSGRIPAAVLGGAGSGTYKVIVNTSNTGGAYFAGQHAKADPSDGQDLTIPHFQRTSSVSFVYDASFVPPINHPPVPDAGPDSTYECNGWPASSIMLDGTGSYDPDGDPLTYNWWSPGITFDDPTSPTPIGQFPLGTTTVTLTVSDGEFTEGVAVDITVEDTTPPEITVDLNRDVLWPPNHKMADIYATVTVTDVCCDAPTFVLTSVTSNEPDNGPGDGNTVDDIQDADLGTADLHIRLRSERSGGGDGRIYTLVYTAEDCSGNTNTASAHVRVPHDHSGWANCATGFASSGVGFDPAFKQFVLVIRSRPEQYGDSETGDPVVLQPAFEATTLDITKVYVGNTNGAVTPEKSLEVDNNGDGLMDLALYYSTESVNMILGRPDKFGVTDGNDALGLHYVSAEGVDYLVPDIFALGEPVPLIPSIQIPRTGESESGDGEVPKVTALLRSYPNPFNPSTTIPFSLETEGHVTLRIYDARGKLVRNLKDEVLSTGLHEVTWNGRDNNGLSVATGVYFVRFAVGNYATTQKIVMIK